MTMKVVTQDSSANTANTLTLTAPDRSPSSGITVRRKRILIHAITVTTKGADLAADMGVLLTTSTAETWNAELRSGKVFGAHFSFYNPIDCGIEDGNVTIVADAGGASVVSTLSVQYELV
jgi:hypothetical protein